MTYEKIMQRKKDREKERERIYRQTGELRESQL